MLFRSQLERALAAEPVPIAAAALPGAAALAVAAPWAGRVTAVAAHVGQGVGKGQPLATLADKRLARVRFVGRSFGPLRPGDAVAVAGGPGGEWRFDGHVVDVELPLLPPTGAVDRAARARPAGGDARLVVDLADPGELLSMAAVSSLRLLGDEAPAAFRVPAGVPERVGQDAFLWWVDAHDRLARSPASLLGREGGDWLLALPGGAPAGSDAVPFVRGEQAAAIGLGARVRLVAP